MTDVAYRRLLPGDLKPFAAVAQTLDNQWVPRALLTDMITRGHSLADVRAERDALVRTEYLRALLNAEQLVVNRVFFFNNPAVYGDFAEPGPDRDAFRALLADQVLVPFLYEEDSPVDASAGTRISGLTGWAPWLEVARDTEVSCVRLAWSSDEANRTAISRGLNMRFHEFVASLRSKCLDGGDQIFASHLGVAPDRAGELGRRLGEAAVWAFHASRHVTREEFYREFVVDGDPAAGHYSPGKPFAAELKLLADLAYNTMLPETLDRYPLRPEDSLNRSAMQEWKQSAGRSVRPVSGLRALDHLLLRRQAFDLATTRLTVPPMGGLRLSHVAEARRTDEWQAYLVALNDVTAHPETFETGAQGLQRAYAALLARLGRIAGSRPDTISFGTGVGFNLDFAGVLLKVRWFGGRLFYRQVGAPPDRPRATVGMSRVVVAGDDVDTRRSRNGGHQLAVDLQPIAVENPREYLSEAISRLDAAGAVRVDRGTGLRDGGLESDLESEPA